MPIEQQSPWAPPIGKKCDDCGCCLATIKADDSWVCWECDEGVPCKGKLAPQPAPAMREAQAPPPAKEWEPPRASPLKGVAHLPGEPKRARVRPSGVMGRSLVVPAETRRAIAEEGAGVPIATLEQKYGVSKSTVKNIRRAAAALRAQAAAIFAGAKGAAPDAEPAASVCKEQSMTVLSNKPGAHRIPDDVRAAIVAADPSVSHTELARLYGITDVTVYTIRKKAGISLVKHKRGRPKKAAKPAKPAPVGIVHAKPEKLSIADFGHDLDGARLDRIFSRLALPQKGLAIKAAIESLLA